MDPQFFGDMDVYAEPLLAYIEDSRRTGGEHVTMTHLVGRAVAHGLATVPDLRVRIAHGRVYERQSIDVFFIVATRGGRELTGVKVADADRKTAVEIAAEPRSGCGESITPTHRSRTTTGCRSWYSWVRSASCQSSSTTPS